MANKMLIDAAHPEETRVVVLRGHRVEEFDFESANKKQLRGNIYLAKVTRVEPSLQAAFIDYGGNRHGFLAFSEIHPDYYQIPVSDRQALIDADAQDEREEEEERKPRRSRRRRSGNDKHAAAKQTADESVSEEAHGDDAHDDHAHHHPAHDHQAHHQQADDQQAHADDEPHHGDHDETGKEDVRPVERDAADKPLYDDPTPNLIDRASVVHAEGPAPVEATGHQVQDAPLEETHSEDTPPTATDADAETGAPVPTAETPHDHHGHEHDHAHHNTHDDSEDDEDDDEDSHDEEEDQVEHLGGDAMEEVPVRTYRPRRQYKIQEVIKRRQILLVQVVKEERGNKGAALTTYLSLAGRYSVLMPNTARGGGISRKITDASDRQRLKSIAQELEVPDGMGVILRTAGASRTKPEVKRDFEYLMRMWETVREATMKSTAPDLVYEEGSLIKRAIRDLYNKDVEEVVVAGEDGYREAKDFMRLLMPSHAKNVQPWRDAQPIFTKHGAESQLDAMFSNQVTLKSGGYIVINQTEALVAIDVNSGRSTREHNIEDTALRTNLEAADEVARQLRLRDLAGLIVVDFIDMEENRNNRSVERRMKDALKNDRARIQIGRISHFGLLEMSRQRIRTGVLEGSTVICQHCAGAGMVRSTSSIALHILRILEDALISDASRNIVVRTRSSVALYILNQKRAHLADLEARFGAAVSFEMDEELTGMTYCAMERTEPATGIVSPVVRHIPVYEPEAEEVATLEDEDGDEESSDGQSEANGDGTKEDGTDTRRRRRRRRGRGRDRESSGIAEDAPQPADDALAFVTDVEGARVSTPDEQSGEDVGEEDETSEGDEAAAGDARNSRRRRSRRGGRRAREGRERQTGLPQFEEGQQDGTQGEHLAEGQASDEPVAVDHADHEPVEAPALQAEAEPIEAPVPEVVQAEAKAPEPEIKAAEPKATVIPVKAAEAPEVPEAPQVLKAPDVVKAPDVLDAPAPRKPEPVSSELDPSRPKRSGWWQRAKASLGG